MFGNFSPSNIHPGEKSILELYYFDTGAEAGTATVTDTLPMGLTVGSPLQSDCTGSGRIVTCSVHSDEVSYMSRPQELDIPVEVAEGLSGEATDSATIGGPGAPNVEHASIPAKFSSASSTFGLAAFDVFASNEDGTLDTQAGSHPFDFTVAFAMNTEFVDEGGEERQVVAGGEERDIDVKLPPGLVGNAQAAPKCSRARFDPLEFATDERKCPADTQIGMDYPSIKCE